MGDNHNHNHNQKLNIRKRVQRVLYSTISSSAYDDDIKGGTSADAAPMPHLLDIEPSLEFHDLRMAKDSNGNNNNVTIGNNNNQQHQTLMKHSGNSNVNNSNNNTSTTSNAYQYGVSYAVVRPIQHAFRSMCLLIEWIATSSKRCWILLIVAIFIEIYATTLMKIAVDSKNLTKTFASTWLYLISLLMFGVSLRQIDVSVAYATWTAVGTASVAVFGILLFKEDYSAGKLLSLLLIVSGVIGLNLSEKH